MAGGYVGLQINPLLAAKNMSAAIGFAVVIIAFGIFMPDVLRALSVFLLTLFGKATAFLQALPVASPAPSSTLGR